MRGRPGWPQRATHGSDGAPPAPAGRAVALAGVSAVSAGAACGAGVAAGAGWVRAIEPSRVPLPVAGAARGALATAEGLGVYTGGSSSIVYSRIRSPCDQVTCTSRVTNGSVIGSVDFSLTTWRPSGVRTTFSETLLR